MGFYRGPNTVTNGLVLALDAGNIKSYQSGSTIWYDKSGNNNNGTLTNGPTFSSGSIVFDAVNDYITASSSLFAFGTGDFTIGVWIYPQSFSTYTHLIALSSQSDFALKANINDGQLYFYSPVFTTFASTTGWTLSLNTWNYVVFKRESFIAHSFLNSRPYGTKSGFNNNFTIQTLNIHNGHPSEYAQCKMSTISIYNRALSAAEILQNYNATKGRFNL